MKKILVLITIILSAVFFYSCDKDNNVDENLNDSLNNVIENSKGNEEIPLNETNDEDEVTEEVLDEVGDFKGYMWSVEKDGSTVYMFGSIHMANDSMYPFHPEVEAAFKSSDHLVVEADPTDISQLQAMTEKMIYTGTETVYDYLSKEGIIKYELICESLGIKPEMLQKIQIWALGANLMAMQLAEADYQGDSGVDMYFVDKAKKASKSLLELEGVMFQVDLLSSFAPEVQEEMFITALGTVEESIEEFNVLYNNYLTGDVELMTEYLMTEEISSYPEAEKAMLGDRNIGMADKINGYLETGEQYFVVVGVAHLLGDESVIKILESKGYEVNRLE